jgi:hypothetical protein
VAVVVAAVVVVAVVVAAVVVAAVVVVAVVVVAATEGLPASLESGLVLGSGSDWG